MTKLQPTPHRPLSQPWLSLWLPLVMLAFVPILTDFLFNRSQASVIDLCVPLLLNLMTATVVAMVFFNTYKKGQFAGFVSSILSLLVLTNTYEPKFQTVLPLLKAINPVPGLEVQAIFSLVYIIIIICLAHGLGQLLGRWFKQKQWQTKEAHTALTIVIVVTFLFQFVPSIRAIAGEWPQFFYRPQPLPALARATTNTKPDIYYIVLDRYTSQDVLKNQFDYDNTPFTDFLKNNQFFVNPSAHSNYPYTTMSVAATLNATYHTDMVQKFGSKPDQTVEPYHLSIRHAPVIERLKQLGYAYYSLGSWYEASNQAPLADRNYQQDGLLTVLGHTFILDSFAKNELANSLYKHLLESHYRIGKFTLLRYQQQAWDDTITYQLKNLEKIAAESSGSRFIFAHILVPHDPYFFNADGSRTLNAESNNIGKPIKQKYLDQVKFINTQMERLITKITTASNGQAVIVLQSDEGPYPMILNQENFNWTSIGQEIAEDSMLDWSDKDLKMKLGTLAAYRVPNASAQDIATAGDAINIFRLIFNTYFGDTLAYLPDCFYAYSNGRDRPFVYSDVTERLTGQVNSACPSDSNFK